VTLQHDERLSSVAINFNLRRYTSGRQRIAIEEEDSSDEDDVFAEVVAKAEAAKNRGNVLFKSGEFTSAEAAYSEAISFGRVRCKLHTVRHVTHHTHVS